MLFEKVLRRFCPCYYACSEENEVLCAAIDDKKDLSCEIYDSNWIIEGNDAQSVYDDTRINESFSAANYWGGTFDLINPQPLYAVPMEEYEVNTDIKHLLRPPLYWKKTMKNFDHKVPLIIEEFDKRSMYLYNTEKTINRKSLKKFTFKHCETVADVRSVFSEVNGFTWFRSQSLHDVTLDSNLLYTNPVICSVGDAEEKSASKKFENGKWKHKQKMKKIGIKSKSDIYTNRFQCRFRKFRVIPDISYGVIVFSAAYNAKRKLFLLKIDRLESLSPKSRKNNPYRAIVKLAVCPSDKYFKCTKILKKSSVPLVKEEFSFTVKENSGKVLRLSVFDSVAQNYVNAVGHALLNLDGIISPYQKKFRMKLYRHTQPHITPGNLALSLGYNSEERKFTVLVVKAKNLIPQKDQSVKLSTYVKGTLYSKGSKLKSKKSVLVNNSKDPNYNSTFTFHVDEDDTDDLLIVMSVRLKSFIKDVTLGRVILGPFFVAERKKLTPWGRVFLKHELVSHWFRLYL